MSGMSLGAAWYLEQVQGEYERFVAGTLMRQIVADPMGDGEFVLCGEVQDGLRGPVAACFVGADGAVTPLGVGEAARVTEVVAPVTRRWREGPRPPTPRVRLGGRCHSFRRALGRYLLGVAEVGERVLMLGALGESIGVIALEGDTPEVLFVGEPGTIGVIDADRLLETWREGHAPSARGERRARGARAARPASGRGIRRPPSSIQLEHRRVCGLPVEVAGGPPIPEVLARIFAGLVARAEAKPRGLTPEQAKSWGCCRGRRWIGPVCDALRRYALLGLGDLTGVVGEVHASIQRVMSGFSVPVEALGLVLRRLWVLGCGLVEKTATGKTWTIRVGAVADPRSRVHRQMCQETATRVAVEVEGVVDARLDRADRASVRRSRRRKMTDAVGGAGAGGAEVGGAGRRGEPEEFAGRSAGEAARDGAVADTEGGGGEAAAKDPPGAGLGERVPPVGEAGGAAAEMDRVVMGGERFEGASAGGVIEFGEAAPTIGRGPDPAVAGDGGEVGRGQPSVVRRLAELVPTSPEAAPLLVVTVVLMSMVAWWEEVDPEFYERALLAARPWLAAVVSVVEGVPGVAV